MTGQKRVAILQSCYIPWRGYFDIIGLSDVFVVYDDVQYSKNHWHNRNRIRDASGTPWLTIPVSLPSGLSTRIDEVQIDGAFARRHWKTIQQCYSKAAHFDRYADLFSRLYGEAQHKSSLSETNVMFLKAISAELGLRTEILLSSGLGIFGDKSGRLLSICQNLGATKYLSGPSAQSYLETDRFTKAGIEVDWMDYSGYPPYKQSCAGFEPAVSVIDLLFNVGPDARSYMKS